MSSITVEDIISDLAIIQQGSPSSSAPTQRAVRATDSNARHPLLQLGHSLLPDALRSSDPPASSRTPAVTVAGSAALSTSSEGIESSVSALENGSTLEKQKAALHLSSLYLDITGEALALDQTGKAESEEGQSSGVFDNLHRRVAILQAANDSSLTKAQEIRNLIGTSDQFAVSA